MNLKDEEGYIGVSGVEGSKLEIISGKEVVLFNVLRLQGDRKRMGGDWREMMEWRGGGRLVWERGYWIHAHVSILTISPL